MRFLACIAWVLVGSGLLVSNVAWSAPPIPEPQFIRADVDGDSLVNISDPVRTLSFLFLGAERLPCEDAADVDDDGILNITDPLITLNFLFLGGPAPAAPFPDCGGDWNDDSDSLTCEEDAADCRFVFSDIDAIRAGYGTLTTIAGKGAVSTNDVNNWDEAFEGESAVEAELSKPHIALADADGNIYIADKEAHGIRRVSPDGNISTVAGTNQAGDDGDDPGPATELRLNEPNGLWVHADGTFYILDTGNACVRKVATDGTMTTLVRVPGLRTGRGLYVSDDESVAYVTSRTTLFKWTPDDGLTTFSSGFSQLGNIVYDEREDVLIATDRNANRVYRVLESGERELLAGDGSTTSQGDGAIATETGLAQVRGVWPGPLFGDYFLATQSGHQVWYLDSQGTIHLLIDGGPGAHSGDGEYAFDEGEKVSAIRSITGDREGNLLITEHDAGYVRRVEFWGIAVP